MTDSDHLVARFNALFPMEKGALMAALCAELDAGNNDLRRALFRAMVILEAPPRILPKTTENGTTLRHAYRVFQKAREGEGEAL